MQNNYYNPLVTIHCWTFNHKPYIQQCLDGFVMQKTEFPFLAVVVDDASTDGEQEVLWDFINNELDTTSFQKDETDDFIRVVAPHKTNKHCIFIFILLKYNHYSIRKAKRPYFKEWEDKTKYIAICEGDDYWTHPLKLQMQFKALEAHPECSFSGSGFTIHSFGKESKDMTIIDNGKELIIYGIEALGRLWVAKTLTLLINKNCYSVFLKEKDKYKSPKDTYLVYHLFKQGKCAYIAQSLGIYNDNMQGIWNSKSYAEKISWDKNTYRELYWKNNKDRDIYDLYLSYIYKNLWCKEIKTNRLKLWFEGVLLSKSLRELFYLTKAFLSKYKKLIWEHLSQRQ